MVVTSKKQELSSVKSHDDPRKETRSFSCRTKNNKPKMEDSQALSAAESKVVNNKTNPAQEEGGGNSSNKRPSSSSSCSLSFGDSLQPRKKKTKVCSSSKEKKQEDQQRRGPPVEDQQEEEYNPSGGGRGRCYVRHDHHRVLHTRSSSSSMSFLKPPPHQFLPPATTPAPLVWGNDNLFPNEKCCSFSSPFPQNLARNHEPPFSVTTSPRMVMPSLDDLCPNLAAAAAGGGPGGFLSRRSSSLSIPCVLERALDLTREIEDLMATVSRRRGVVVRPAQRMISPRQFRAALPSSSLRRAGGAYKRQHDGDKTTTPQQ